VINHTAHILRFSSPVLCKLDGLSALGCVKERRCSDITANVS
jgi:hypothetical protein